jgi:hypothetical protein
MGADLIGWRNCELQKPLGAAGFHGKLKMKAYLRVIESQVPEDKRADVSVTIVVNDRERELSYGEIREQAETFQRGIPACATCPLAGGEQLGCYKYVTYPLDEPFERIAFEFFASQVATKNSIADQLYRDIVSKVPASSGWYSRRGPRGPLARLAAPLAHSWGGVFSKKKVDSAQLMASLFIPLDQPAVLVAYARFWTELVEYAAQKLGKDELSNGTIAEVRAMVPMLVTAAAHAIGDGWKVVVDS